MVEWFLSNNFMFFPRQFQRVSVQNRHVVIQILSGSRSRYSCQEFKRRLHCHLFLAEVPKWICLAGEKSESKRNTSLRFYFVSVGLTLKLFLLFQPLVDANNFSLWKWLSVWTGIYFLKALPFPRVVIDYYSAVTIFNSCFFISFYFENATIS